jgi:hypothetical protein
MPFNEDDFNENLSRRWLLILKEKRREDKRREGKASLMNVGPYG